MIFDPTIDLGNLLSFGSLLVSGIAIWVRQEKIIQKLSSELDALREWLDRLDTKGTSYSHSLAERVARVEGTQ